MKKLAIFFVVLLSLLVIAGCNESNKKVTRFAEEDMGPNGTKAIITPLDEKEPSPEVIEIKNANENEEEEGDSEEGSDPTVNLTAFEITSFDEEEVATSKSYHVISGTAPENTAKILVNDFALSKYKAGDTKWSYIAATSLGTLKKGNNIFTFRALDEDGEEIGRRSLTISYEGKSNGVLADTGGNTLIYAGLLTLFFMTLALGGKKLNREFLN